MLQSPPNLKNEGIARELVNRIQNIRKDAGYEVTDRVEVRILENEILEVAVQENMDYIKQETLTEVLKFVGELEEGTDIAFDDITTKLNIVKH
jgi:isoleucyl-tRNA synthetase